MKTDWNQVLKYVTSAQKSLEAIWAMYVAGGPNEHSETEKLYDDILSEYLPGSHTFTDNRIGRLK